VIKTCICITSVKNSDMHHKVVLTCFCHGQQYTVSSVNIYGIIETFLTQNLEVCDRFMIISISVEID